MKAQFNSVQRRLCRKSPRQARLDGRSKAQQRDRHEDTTQLIYAHLPPAVVMAAEQHLRAQTNIAQRAHELWFAQGCRPGGALGNWIRAECEVVQKLCQALLTPNTQEPEPPLVSNDFMNQQTQCLRIQIHKVDGSVDVKQPLSRFP